MDPILLLKCKVLAIKLLIIELYKNNIMLYISYTIYNGTNNAFASFTLI